MAKKSRKRRASSSSTTALLVLLAVAAVTAAWFILRPPSHARRHHTVARATVSLPRTTATAAAAVTPESSATPLATTPSSGETPSPKSVESARPSPSHQQNAGNAKLALIIDDCGQWVSTERAFIALPVPLTLSVLPHVRFGATIAQEASDAGKGVMLHLPMETLSGMYPGPGEVTTAMTDRQIATQVEDDLAQVPLAEGVNNHEGSKASADRRVMTDVIDVLSKHGHLFWIDSKTNAASVGESVAQASSVPTAARDVFLDNQADVAYSEAQLRSAASIAERTGSAIAIGHPKPTTLAAVRALIPELQDEGVDFVLVSSLTR